MRVYYRAVRGPAIYRQGPVKFCCAPMCRWWGVLIGFGVGDRPSTDRGVNLFHRRPQANGKSVLEVVPVKHCPWCGEVVETCRVKQP
jgi:hypothetical protein